MARHSSHSTGGKDERYGGGAQEMRLGHRLHDDRSLYACVTCGRNPVVAADSRGPRIDYLAYRPDPVRRRGWIGRDLARHAERPDRTSKAWRLRRLGATVWLEVRAWPASWQCFGGSRRSWLGGRRTTRSSGHSLRKPGGC